MNEVLAFIRREIRFRLGLEERQVLLESPAVLSDWSDTYGTVISLVNFQVSAYQTTGLGRPELLDSLELQLLFSFRFPSYEASLGYLYETVRLFHAKPTYRAADSHPDNPFPPHVERLLFTLCPLGFSDLRDLWGVLGGTMCPCALYSVRMVRKQHA